MAKNTLNRYRLGLGLLGVATVILAAYLISQASGVKQDTLTYNRANAIANKLNDYVDNQQKVPSSLAEAGITNVPSTISYRQIDSNSYQFCATYKSASTNFSAVDSAESAITGQFEGAQNYSSANAGADFPNTTLFIDGSHQKGQNCQTIKPDIFNFQGSGASGTTCIYDFSKSAQQAADDYDKCLLKQDRQTTSID